MAARFSMTCDTAKKRPGSVKRNSNSSSAIEEWGKVSILQQLAVAKTDVDAANASKSYRSHTRKNVALTLPHLIAARARKLDDFAPLFDRASDLPFLLDQPKHLGFYTDCLGDAHWARPWDELGEPLARQLVETAKLFARNSNKYTEGHVTLWIERLGPFGGQAGAGESDSR